MSDYNELQQHIAQLIEVQYHNEHVELIGHYLFVLNRCGRVVEGMYESTWIDGAKLQSLYNTLTRSIN